jgi:hypothetical protein
VERQGGSGHPAPGGGPGAGVRHPGGVHTAPAGAAEGSGGGRASGETPGGGGGLEGASATDQPAEGDARSEV